MTKLVTFWGGESDIPCQPEKIFTHAVFIAPLSSGMHARIMLDPRVMCDCQCTFFAPSADEVMEQVTDALQSLTAHEGLQMAVNDA